MSASGNSDREPATDQRPDLAQRASQAFESAKSAVAGADLDHLRRQASDAATSLYKDGREFISSNPELTKATEDLRDSIRKNPLAAIGVAFTAGLLLALLTRG